MHPEPSVILSRAARGRAATAGLAALALGALLAAQAQTNVPMYRPTMHNGGIYYPPTITSITPSGPTNAVITYSGMEGPYQVQGSSDNANWVVVATNSVVWPNYAGTNTVPTGGTNSFFRLAILNTYYLGVSNCFGCHSDKVNGWAQTGHSSTFSLIADTNGIVQANHLSCLPCHSTGYNQPGGFVTNSVNPHLANVTCEACHGPAGGHVSVGGTRIYRPVPTGVPELCGGCHTGTRHGDYDEWNVSMHRTNYHTSYSCGFCHSGPVRNALLANWQELQNGYTNAMVVPALTDATNWGPTCVTCHDPHSGDNPYALRNPLWSTNYFTVTNYNLVTMTNYYTNVFGTVTTTVGFRNDNFVAQYDPTVQICAQCHNSRGGSWVNTSGPHQASIWPVFNGIIEPGYPNTANIIGAHGLNTNGCAVCHMAQITPYGSITTNNPVYHGHKFNWAYSGYVGCVTSGCHNEDPTSVTNTMLLVSNKMVNMELEIRTGLSNVVALLNNWGLNSGATYVGTTAWNASKQYTWEYSSLNVSTNFGPVYPGMKGLNATNQTLLPDNIRQARYELYCIMRDRTYGVHNPVYTRYLINDASNKVVNTP
jgi:hypothetical protein